jgi:dTDP-glucose 4,6-dehydratase
MVLAEQPQTRIVNLDKLTYAGNLANLADLPPERARRCLLRKGDIADRAFVDDVFASRAFDAVVHFAAESHVDRSIADATPFVVTNALGTQVLLDAARKAGVPRFVHVSTDEVYGSLGAEGAFHENTPLAPNSPYSASKAASDFLVRAAHETFGQNTVITRCSNNYGPRQFPEKLIPLVIRRARRREPLPVYGTGANVRDWIHVEDHCRGVLLALEKGRPGAVYNFGGGSERANIDVVRALLRLLDRPESLIRLVADRPGHDLRYAMDFSLASRELGFAPAKTFEQGLAETVAWYEEHQDWAEQVESGAYRDFEQLWYGERV